MKKIIVVGSANTDMVVKTDKLPLPGETKLGRHFFYECRWKRPLIRPWRRQGWEVM